MQPLPDMNQLMKLASSPAGQKLLHMLRSDTSLDLEKLAQDASSGNLSHVKQQLSGFLDSEETHALLKELELPHE